MRKYIFYFLLFLYFCLPADMVVAKAGKAPNLYPTQSEAQKYCLKEEIVWFSFKTNTYYHKSNRWYGNAQPGAFVCKREAEAAGIKCCTGEEPRL